MKFFIEKFKAIEVDGKKFGAWVRIPGATATTLKDAEYLKTELRKIGQDDVKNYTIVCCTDGEADKS